MKQHMDKIAGWLKIWILLAIVSTMFAGLVYAAVQQTYRTGANDPQVEITEDVAAALNQGADPQAIVPPSPLDISSSLAPFIVIYTATGTPVASSGQLGGKTPTPPQGVFDSVKSKGQDRFTWQPQPGVRIAAVMDKFSGPDGGYILAGRSLREVEKNENNLVMMVAIAWAASLLLSLLFCIIFFGKFEPHNHREEKKDEVSL